MGGLVATIPVPYKWMATHLHVMLQGKLHMVFSARKVAQAPGIWSEVEELQVIFQGDHIVAGWRTHVQIRQGREGVIL